MIKWILLVSLLIAFCGLDAQAQVNAASCSAADVNTAISAATAGETINIPAGNCTWSGSPQVSITTSVTLSGAGAATFGHTCPLTGATGTNIDLSGQSVFALSKATGIIRVRNVNFLTTGSSGDFPITIGGNWLGTQPVIFQNNSFCTDGTLLNIFDIFVAGGFIFANNTVTDTGLGGGGFSIKNPGDTQSWSMANSLGTNDTNGLLDHYIESNTWYGGGNGIDDCDDACRIVVRYNTLNMAGFNSHGEDTSPQGMREFEIYNNSFLFPDQTCLNGNASLSNINQWIWIRGASGVIFNNNFDSLYSSCWGDKNEVLMSIRGAEDHRPQGTCAQVAYPVPHQLGQDNNGTSDYTDPIWFWGNTSNNGPDAGDSLKIQVGAGWGWGNPCAFNFSQFFNWGTDAVNTAVGTVSGGSAGVNVDGVLGTAKPGYTPYTYPHPLISGSTSGSSSSGPSAPSNLTAVVN